MRLASFAGLLLLAALGLWWALGRDADTGLVADTPTHDERPTDTGLAAGPSVRESVDAETAEATTEPAAGGPAPAPPEDALTGVVLDPDDAPVAGARVVLDYQASVDLNILDLAYAERRIAVAEAESADDGSFRFEVPVAWPMRVSVTAKGFGRAIVEGVFGGEHHVVRLGPAVVLRGRITRAADGSAVEGVPIRVWSTTTRRRYGDTLTDANGDYAFRDLPPDVIEIAVEPRTLADPEWATVELEAGRETVRDFALADGVRIRGVVTDAASGLPIEGAEVGAGWSFDRSAHTDVNGEYAIDGFGGWGVYEIHARAPRYGPAVHAFPSTEMPEVETRVDFVLQPGRRARGRVLDASGAPLAGVYAAAIGQIYVGLTDRNDWTSTTTDGDGVFELDSIDPELSHYLFLRKRGHGSLVYDFPDDEKETPVVDLGTFTLPRPGRISGTVRDAEGNALPATRVELSGHNADRFKLRATNKGSVRVANTTEREGRSGTDARFHFADLAPGEYAVHALRSQRVVSPTVTVDLSDGEQRTDLELVIDLGLSVTGRVESKQGRGLPSVLMWAKAVGDGTDVTVMSGADGRFEIEGLAVGRYDILADPRMLNDGEHSFVAAIARGVVAGTRDLAIVLDAPVEVTGQVFDVDGTPAEKPFMNALVGEHNIDFAVADAEGHFSLSVPPGEVVTVVATATVPADNVFGRDPAPELGRAEVDVEAGSRDVVLTIER